MAAPALSFFAGLAGGYNTQQQRNIENARAAASDQRAQEEHDTRMAQQRSREQERLDLVAAASPATVNVGAGGYTKPDTADNRDVGQPGEPGLENTGSLTQGALVNGQSYPDAAAADKAADAYNSPDAMDKRIGLSMAKYDPMAAQKYRAGAFTLNKEQGEYARKLKDENAFDTARALRTGDPEQIKDAFNKSGQWKIEGEPTVTPKKRSDIPGLPEVTTYDVTVNAKGPDGQTVTKTVNSHDFSMAMLPYEKGIDLQQKGQRNEDRAEFQTSLADVKGKVADAQTAATQARAEAAAAKNAQGPSREERLRWTSLFQDAGRQMIETQKTINQLQRDPVFMSRIRKDPNSAEAKQLANLQSAYTDHQQSRDTFRGLLAGSQTSPSLGDVMPKASPQAMPKDKSQLKAGSVYQTSRGPATWNGAAFEQ